MHRGEISVLLQRPADRTLVVARPQPALRAGSLKMFFSVQSQHRRNPASGERRRSRRDPDSTWGNFAGSGNRINRFFRCLATRRLGSNRAVTPVFDLAQESLDIIRRFHGACGLDATYANLSAEVHMGIPNFGPQNYG